MYSTYDEAIEATLTRARALNEVIKHNLDEQDFLNEMGDRKYYSGQEVLDWLGY